MLSASVIGAAVFGVQRAAAETIDPVLDVVAAEMMKVQRRVGADPHNGEHAKQMAALFRILNASPSAHAFAHRVHHRQVDGAAAASLAHHLRRHGLVVSGDDLLQRHFEARAQVEHADLIERHAFTAITAGQALSEAADIFEAVAVTSPHVGGVTFREGFHEPVTAFLLRTQAPRPTVRPPAVGCAWAQAYAPAWGFLFGVQAFAFGFIPPAAPLALASAAASLFFDGWALWCDS